MNPLAGSAPLVSPASPETVAPPAVFDAPPAPDVLDEDWVEPEIPLRPEPSGQQRPAQRNGQRSGGRQNRQGSGGRGKGNGRRSF
ncbi:hypothetical protein ACX8Z9_02950 [Arthrobacter halodurans]